MTKTAWERVKSESLKTEARRIARQFVKDELKRQGIKVSHVESSEITKAAYHLLHCEPGIIDDARREIYNRSRRKLNVDISKIPPRRRK